MNKDYKMVIDWMGDSLIQESEHVFLTKKFRKFNPKEDLNCWPSIYENMTEVEIQDYIDLIVDVTPGEYGPITRDIMIHTCPSKERYAALVEMLKES